MQGTGACCCRPDENQKEQALRCSTRTIIQVQVQVPYRLRRLPYRNLVSEINKSAPRMLMLDGLRKEGIIEIAHTQNSERAAPRVWVFFKVWSWGVLNCPLAITSRRRHDVQPHPHPQEGARAAPPNDSFIPTLFSFFLLSLAFYFYFYFFGWEVYARVERAPALVDHFPPPNHQRDNTPIAGGHG